MNPTIKLLLVPAILIAAISTMYFMSINSGDPINRADAAFIMMGFLSGIHAYTTFKWYKHGYMIYTAMKKQEEAASSIIEKLVDGLKGETKPSVLKIDEEVAKTIVKDLTKIIDEHKS